MSISPQRVNACRAVVLWVARGVAAVLLTWGVYLCVKRVLFAVGADDYEVIFRLWSDDLGESNSFYRGISMIAVGIVLASLGGLLSRWIIAIPHDGCPRCGQERGPGQTTCPECGLRLS